MNTPYKKARLERAAELETLRRQLAEARATDWRPISTAPRNGEKFLAYAANGRIRVDWLDESQSSGADRYWQEHADNRYTHWMPLPKPPSAPQVAHDEGDGAVAAVHPRATGTAVGATNDDD